MLEQRRKLPAWQERENILGALEQSQVLVVSGMTGWVTWLFTESEQDATAVFQISRFDTLLL